MSKAANVLNGIPAPLDRWDAVAVEELDLLDSLAYRSNLLGATGASPA